MSPNIPVPAPVGQNEEGDLTMAESTAQFGSLHDQNMAAMGQAMAQFQVNSVTVSKATDYQHLAGLDLVSLTESVGVREVASRVNPAGPAPATA